MTTTDSMKYLFEKNEMQISVKIPKSMKMQISRNAKRLKMLPSTYMKLAISERIEKDASIESHK